MRLRYFGIILLGLSLYFTACQQEAEPTHPVVEATYSPPFDKYEGAQWQKLDSTPVNKRYAANLNGEYIIKWVWYKKDKPIREYIEINKKRDGISKEYFDNGNVAKLAQYVQGKKTGVEYEWYPTGELKSLTTYLKNARTGEFMGWYKSGKMMYNGYLIDGLPREPITRWTEDGKVKKDGDGGKKK
ncbi:MAG: hypothetical protein R2798_13475 [Chitinophagales bacterium]|nr:hypothetical protein [Bacteroidota bacterium]MCB9044236.1 hypothetical protein [Chitinophagales bacterium]